MSLVIQKAQVGDVPAIASLVNDYAEQGRMLHRGRSEIYERLRDYHVVRTEGGVDGVGALRVMTWDLAEIYALAVRPDAVGRGLGRRLVDALINEARQLGIGRLFALTYERAFFERCGFEVVDRHQALPVKVWSECVRCSKREACDEIAMVRRVEGVRPLSPPAQIPSETPVRMPVLSETMRRIDRSASSDNP
ncbi:MAG: N-acetyltransferase [Phycisphaeraceae bacterium]|nr:N-acetyltransferase [Phycisphaeraceae bacterium]